MSFPSLTLSGLGVVFVGSWFNFEKVRFVSNIICARCSGFLSERAPTSQ